MSVIVYIESEENKIKKASLEVVCYAKKISEYLKKDLIAVSFNLTDFSILNNYGVDKLYNISDNKLKVFEVNAYSNNLFNLFNELKPEIVIVTSSLNSRYLGPILASKLDAAYMSNVVSLPTSYSPISVKRSCFTNKAFNETSTKKSVVVLSLSSNSYGLHENKSNLVLEEINGINSNSSLKVDSLEKLTNKVTIADADIVVSGGRGLKGPENWHLIENLAEALGAATACSKPVSDLEHAVAAPKISARSSTICQFSGPFKPLPPETTMSASAIVTLVVIFSIDVTLFSADLILNFISFIKE